MMDLRPITLVIGILLTTLGLAMILPALLDLAYGNDDWLVFAQSSTLTLFIGGGLVLSTWGRTGSLSVKQAFILTVATWIALTAFAALPFSFSELGPQLHRRIF